MSVPGGCAIREQLTRKRLVWLAVRRVVLCSRITSKTPLHYCKGQPTGDRKVRAKRGMSEVRQVSANLFIDHVSNTSDMEKRR